MPHSSVCIILEESVRESVLRRQELGLSSRRCWATARGVRPPAATVSLLSSYTYLRQSVQSPQAAFENLRAGAALKDADQAGFMQAFLGCLNAAGIWAALAFAGAAGLWAERTKWGKEMSGALISTLVGLALSNLNVIPSEAPHVYGVVNAYLLPLAVPLLLFSADLRYAGGTSVQRAAPGFS